MIDVDWGDANGKILVWTFYDGWTAQDFIQAFTTSENAVAKSHKSSHVHVLLDVQHTAYLPKDMLTLGRYAIKRAADDRQKGLIVIINPSKIWKRFYDILKPMFPHSLKICFANNADEAYQMMHEIDALFTKHSELR
jgi:hypothetical protein